MNIRKIPVAQLNPAKYNPRKDLKPGDAEYEKLRRSIEEFGYVEPIIWNSRTGSIVGGHQRFKVLVALGYTEVDCVVLDIDENKEKALNVALNKISGEFDIPLLTDLLKDIGASGFDVSLTGFDATEMNALFDKGDGEVKEDNFDVDSELQKPCFTHTGDVWQLGKHTVLCGDSTVAESYATLLGDTKVNLVCTDPPYFVALESASGKITNDNLSVKEGYAFLMKAFSGMKSSMALDASIYTFYATATARIFHDAFEDAGFKVGAGLVWKKDQLVLTRTDWKYIHEPILFGWRRDGKHRWYGDQKQKTVFEFDRIKNSKDEGCGHPSSKPVPLIAYLVKQCTQTNSLVLDPFLGSASTLIACDQLGRICYGIEYEPKFVDVAVMRYITAKGRLADDVFVERDGKRLSFAEVKPADAAV